MDTPAPIQLVRDLVNSHALARCLHVVAELGVADALQEEPAAASELASRTGANADALNRVLRLLAAHGVFAHGPDGYSHTDASRLLRSDHPQSLRSFGRMMGMPVVWNGFTELGAVARSGVPALDWAGLVAYFASHPEEAALFNEAMVGKSGAIIPAVVDAYDFTPFATIADIGGGRGHLLRAILQRSPATSGILFDLPHVIAEVTNARADRLRLAAGDFFVDPLPAADAYLLMEVVHDWADDRAVEILAAVRRAAPAHARVLVIESLVTDAPGPHFSKTLDVIMLAITGGRERTAQEYDALFSAAGFRVERIIPTRSQHSLVEAVVSGHV
jgi:hypothetical protein